MLPDNHQQLHHTFIEFCICLGNLLSKKDLQKQPCHTILKFYTEQEQNQIPRNIY